MTFKIDFTSLAALALLAGLGWAGRRAWLQREPATGRSPRFAADESTGEG